ncbi:MAG: hypothetical protein WCB03_20655 [Rouxiella badensis]|jgi:hypothetical protein|uniref:hypothetical protein n=1 Tax=Rouxiella badensis TaxID=1646377 RepID=UPI0028D20414|nr:hypothetical protein [Rouxiella badensis]
MKELILLVNDKELNSVAGGSLIGDVNLLENDIEQGYGAFNVGVAQPVLNDTFKEANFVLSVI